MIVPVDEANLLEAALIHSVSWQDSHRSFCPPDFVALHTPERQREYLREKMNAGSRVYMLVEDRPVGIVSVTGSLIEDLYILPEMQNKGYGKEAIRRLIDYAFKEIKLDRLFLKVYKDNSRAIHVYQECGFKEYKHDDKDIYMELINIDKYRVNPVKVSKKKSHKKELSGEDIDLLRDNRNIKKNKSICDTHEDGA